MNIECNVSELYSALVTTAKGAAKVSAYCLALRDGKLRLSSTGEHQTVYQTIKTPDLGAALDLQFVGAPDAGLLKGFAGPCTVEATDTHITVRQGGQTLASYACALVETPPPHPTIEPHGAFSVDASTLVDVLTRTVKTSGDKVFRKNEVVALSLKPFNGRVALDVASTDSIRLTLCQLVVEGKVDAPTQLLLRADGVKSLLKILPKRGTIALEYDREQVLVAWEGTVVSLVRSEDRFPNYSSIMPKSQACVWDVDNAKLVATMKTLLPAAKANDKKCKAVLELVPETTELIIHVKDTLGGVDLERGVTLDRLDGCTTKNARIAFNLAYFLEFLTLNPHKSCRVGWTSTTYPATLTPLEQDPKVTYTVILMPITHY
jgi:DNA polymerase III sliding clamp (beta) subunit (PCNA family)